jgi:hypothetical protein
MASFPQRARCRGLVAGVVLAACAGEAMAEGLTPGSFPANSAARGPAQETAPVSYTPMRRPAAPSAPKAPVVAPIVPPAPKAPPAPLNVPPASYTPRAPYAAPAVPATPPPSYVAPAAPYVPPATYVAPAVPSAPVAPFAPDAPTYVPIHAPAAPPHVVPEGPYVPPAPYFLPVASSAGNHAGSVPAAAQTSVAVAAARPAGPKSGGRVLGLGIDLGVPDGVNLGLMLSPSDWLRLEASLGTNSASLGYRGGLSLVPVGWGPSFTFELGHCNLAAPTDTVRTFFSVPKWVEPYVQQLGYTYFNAHLGFDLVYGRATVFIHGGYSYLMGTVRAPAPVVVDQSNTSVTLAEDGKVYAHTLSAKVGLIVMFGGS